MSKIWIRDDHEYISDFGIVTRDNSGDNWIGFVKEGFGFRVCGKNYKRVRDAMTGVEEASKQRSPLPPIRFPAHIF